MQRLIQCTTALLLALTSLTVTPAIQPERAHAVGETVATCDEESFDAALNALQSAGGGPMNFICSGTITFSSQKIITTNVEIDGVGQQVAFDGGNATRLFNVNVGAALELRNLTLQNGNASPGGAISNEGALTVIRSTFSGNQTDEFGTPNQGGAIFNTGTATIASSIFDNNLANRANGSAHGGAIYTTGALVITTSSFVDNRAGAGFGSVADTGGAIYNNNTRVVIVASTFSGNTARAGGAIYHVNGRTTIAASTFSTNQAIDLGGAILISAGLVTTSASTFKDNLGGNAGGAVQVAGHGTLSVTSSTFSDNSAVEGSAINADGRASVRASILVGNSATGDCSGSITSNGSNLSDDGSCPFTATGDIQNSTAANLGTLADNGGPTQTMLPGADSDALDAASCALSSRIDQRGGARPSTGSACDIGAVEVGATLNSPRFVYIGNSSPVPENNPVRIQAFGYDGSGRSLSYAFDCDNDGSFEVTGGSGSIGNARCTYLDNGNYTVGVQVCDASNASNCETGSTTVTVNNVNPTITDVTNDGPIEEGGSATITITATDPAGVNDPLMYAFDCDNDGTFEVSPQAANSTSCNFAENGRFAVPVRVTDDDGGATTGSSTVTVNNAAPSVNAPVVNPSPSDEGQSVVANATFSDPGTLDTHTCTVDYGDGSGQQAGVISGDTCTGPHHTYLDDDPSGTSYDQYTVTVTVIDDDAGVGSNTATQTVNNVPPVIHQITTNGPVPQGQPATITVLARDVGVNDSLTYRFDCDGDGSYETAGTANQATCTLDPAAATSTIGIQVEDDDLGVASGIAEVTQTVILCVNRTTGAVTETNSTDGCTTGTVATTVPGAPSLSFCINRSTNELRVVFRSGCASSERTHIVPDNGPLFYCENRWTGELRFSSTATCGHYENSGVIPG